MHFYLLISCLSNIIPLINVSIINIFDINKGKKTPCRPRIGDIDNNSLLVTFKKNKSFNMVVLFLKNTKRVIAGSIVIEQKKQIKHEL